MFEITNLHLTFPNKGASGNVTNL